MLKVFLFITITCMLFMACNTPQIKEDDNWCSQKPRAQFATLLEIPTTRPWFKVYGMGNGVYAIVEPYNYQEVISYLITGKTKALLFDTGMGLDSISALVKELTNLPIIVLNSHTHYDHTGGNNEFDSILTMNTPYTIHNAQHGWAHAVVKEDVAPGAFCMDRLPHADTAAYHIKPFKISQFISDGYVIDLGGKRLEVIAAPGHAPDAIALLDRHNGCLWTGDTFYESTIWLFADGTDVHAYQQSIAKLALLAPQLKTLYTSHNTPIAQAWQLIELKNAFAQIKSGKVKGVAAASAGYGFAQGALFFKFKTFSFLIRKDEL